MNDPPSQPKRRRRFSLRFLLIGIAVVAAGLGIWQAVSYRHPAHSNVSYANAPYTSLHSMKVGPNTVSIASIARNRYDGKIHLMSGGGLKHEIPNAQQLKDCAKWLDVVQIEITPGPELIEIVEVRVFDHETRTDLSGGNYGWRVVEPNLIQVYGLGKEVPEKLDLWLRLHSFADRQVYELSPTPGASVNVPGGTISIDGVTDRFAGWSSSEGFYPSIKDGSTQSAVKLRWEGNWLKKTEYQFATVSRTGERELESQSFDLRGESEGRFPKQSQIPLGMIDHYELRSAGFRHRFFFDGLEVPPPVGRTFDPPPKAIINTAAGECEGVLPQFEPLIVRYNVEKGARKYYSGSSLEWGRKDNVREKLDSMFTLELNEHGINVSSFIVRMKDAQSGKWLRSVPKRRGDTCWPGPSQAGSCMAYDSRLSDIGAIEVTLDVP